MTGPGTRALVAAGGLAREVVATLRAAGCDDRLVLLDDDPTSWDTRVAGVPVLGGVDRVADLPDADVVVCAGRGTTRRRLVERLAALGVGPDRFPPVVHPAAEVAAGCVVGPGAVLLAQVVLTADVEVGRHAVVMPHVTLTHDVVVGDFATLCSGVRVGGGAVLGPASYVGMGACVRERVVVGAEAVLGMGAVLTRSLPAGETWVGVPAAQHLVGRAGAA